MNVHEFLDIDKNFERMQVRLDLVDNGSSSWFKRRKPVKETVKVCQSLEAIFYKTGSPRARANLEQCCKTLLSPAVRDAAMASSKV